MDVKSNLLLCEPINFHNICKIYPIELKDFLSDEDKYNEIYTPYVLSKDMIIKEELKQFSMFEIILSDTIYMKLLFESLTIFCKTENIKFIKKTNGDIELYFDDNTIPLTKDNFDEFADIIILSGGKSKYKPEQIPVFETPEGYERWKKYEEAKQKYQKKDDTSIASIINVAQIGNGFYINEEIIKRWSMWKLLNTHSSLVNRDGYDKQYSQYLVTGKPDNIKEHWSDLLKVK